MCHRTNWSIQLAFSETFVHIIAREHWGFGSGYRTEYLKYLSNATVQMEYPVNVKLLPLCQDLVFVCGQGGGGEGGWR